MYLNIVTDGRYQSLDVTVTEEETSESQTVTVTTGSESVFLDQLTGDPSHTYTTDYTLSSTAYGDQSVYYDAVEEEQFDYRGRTFTADHGIDGSGKVYVSVEEIENGSVQWKDFFEVGDGTNTYQSTLSGSATADMEHTVEIWNEASLSSIEVEPLTFQRAADTTVSPLNTTNSRNKDGNRSADVYIPAVQTSVTHGTTKPRAADTHAVSIQTDVVRDLSTIRTSDSFSTSIVADAPAATRQYYRDADTHVPAVYGSNRRNFREQVDTTTIQGVVDYDGASVSGAEVYVMNEVTYRVAARAISDSSGHYEVEVPYGDHAHLGIQYDGVPNPIGEYTFEWTPYGPKEYTHDVSSRNAIYVEIRGAEGGSGAPDVMESSARGGGPSVYVAELDVSDLNELRIIPGQGGWGGDAAGEGAGGIGYEDGSPGSQGDLGQMNGGGGAGSTALLDGNGNEIVRVCGSGGGGGEQWYIEQDPQDDTISAGDGGAGGGTGGGYGGTGGHYGMPIGGYGTGGLIEVIDTGRVLETIHERSGIAGGNWNGSHWRGLDAVVRLGDSAGLFNEESKPYIRTD